MSSPAQGPRILGMRVDPTSYEAAVAAVLAWAREGRGRQVCCANVHMAMEAHDDPAFRSVVNGADLVTPDGMPLAWTLRGLGWRGQGRVCGPELSLRLYRAAADAGIPVGFYGGSERTLEALKARLAADFPRLQVAYAFSPPFRPLSEEEDAAVVRDIRASGARILFVGLGCPKQERWMAAHAEAVPAVMLGVGAAFDFHAGTVKQAPRWMQAAGLEWLYRFFMEPRRLWKRYLKHNPRFAALAALQVLARRDSGRSA